MPRRWPPPKGTDFAAVTAAEPDAVADELNDRPRKRFAFAFATPTEQISELLLQYARIRRSAVGQPDGLGPRAVGALSSRRVRGFAKTRRRCRLGWLAGSAASSGSAGGVDGERDQ
ncbi:MAG TPA: hypothetical protein VNT54_18405 [Solirubrobacteraceae bacterium]|nr:hypothetical protein [Solirubrobacteraceae bacterium]